MRSEYDIQVLKDLFINGDKSRVELSNDLKINKTSISTSVNNLMAEGLLIEKDVGKASSKGGRKPINLSLDFEYAYFMGIDVAKDYISYTVSNMNFEIKTYGIVRESINSLNAADEISKVIRNCENIYNVDGQNKLKGVAIAIHGIVSENQIIFTPNYDLDEVDLYNQLKSEFADLDFTLINESNAAALCEQFMNKVDNLVTINVGSGLGAGIIIDGKLHVGKRGYGGEIGHMIIVPGGSKCHCGNHGCFEQYCSTRADIKYYNQISEDKISSSTDLIKKYMAGENVAIETVNRNIYYMSIGINNMIKTIDPTCVYINSDLAYHIPTYLEKVSNNVKSTFGQDISIEISKFNDKSTLIGSIYNAIIVYYES